MPDISIQFYAAQAETLAFTKDIIAEFELYAAAMNYRPFKVIDVNLNDLQSYFSASSDCHRWAFALNAPRLDVKNELEFGDMNPDHLRLDVGRELGAYLELSWLSCRTENTLAYSIWKRVAKKLKALTLDGVTARNRDNGIQVEYPKFRYSQGAKRLEADGVLMLAATGLSGPEIKLGDLSTSI